MVLHWLSECVFPSVRSQSPPISGERLRVGELAREWGAGVAGIADVSISALFEESSARNLPDKSSLNGRFLKQKRQISETIPMESFNEVNGIVEQNQWNR